MDHVGVYVKESLNEGAESSSASESKATGNNEVEAPPPPNEVTGNSSNAGRARRNCCGIFSWSSPRPEPVQPEQTFSPSALRKIGIVVQAALRISGHPSDPDVRTLLAVKGGPYTDLQLLWFRKKQIWPLPSETVKWPPSEKENLVKDLVARKRKDFLERLAAEKFSKEQQEAEHKRLFEGVNGDLLEPVKLANEFKVSDQLQQVDKDLLERVKSADKFWASEQKERVKRLDKGLVKQVNGDPLEVVKLANEFKVSGQLQQVDKNPLELVKFADEFWVSKQKERVKRLDKRLLERVNRDPLELVELADKFWASEEKDQLKQVDKNLLELVHFADEFWASEQKDRVKRLDSLKADASSGRNELYQLVGLYAVFLSVFFSSASQTNNLQCSASFILVILTFAVTVFTFVVFYNKADSNYTLQVEIAEITDLHKYIETQIQALRKSGPRFDFKSKDLNENQHPTSSDVEKVVGLTFIVTFAIGICIGIVVVLCWSGGTCEDKEVPTWSSLRL